VPADPAPIDPVRILAVLERHGVEYVLIGGVAANVHGYPLPTEDVDVTPASDAANLERLAGALREVGARLRVAGEPEGVPFSVDAAALGRAEIWTLVTDVGDLDVVVLPDGTQGYQDLRRDATREELAEGLTVQVASLADVIRSKEAAGRPKDRAQMPALRETLERRRRREGG
jgi:hypothetical protein